MNQRLVNEHALALARRLVAIVSPCLREEEQAECLAEFVPVCREGIEAYVKAVERMENRLRPVEKGP